MSRTVIWSLAAAFSGCLILLYAGVTTRELAAFLSVAILLQAAPGAFVCRALFPNAEFPLIHACIGAALGIASSILAFLFVASLATPTWFPVIQIAMAGIGVIIAYLLNSKREVAVIPSKSSSWEMLAIIGSMVLLAIANFPFHPLPDALPETGASYYFDLPWHMGISALLKHFWPPLNPAGIGQALNYHIGSHAWATGLSLTGHIEIATLYLRLIPAYCIAIIVLQIAVLGNLTFGAPTGAIASFLFVGTGSAQVLIGRFSIEYYGNVHFLNTTFLDLYASPSQAVSLVLLNALLLVIILALRNEIRLGVAAPIVVLVASATALVKPSALPVLGAALLGFVVWRLVAQPSSAIRPFFFAVLIVLIQVAAVPITLGHNVSRVTGGWFQLGAILWSVPALDELRQTFIGKPILYGLTAGAIMIFAFAPAIALGAAAALAGLLRQRRPEELLLLLIGAAGVAGALSLSHPGNSQLYLLLAGIPALCVVAASGLVALWRRHLMTKALVTIICLIAVSGRLQEAWPGVLRAAGLTTDRERRLDPGLVAALHYIRQSLPPDGVFAVNRQTIDRGGYQQNRNNDYAGLAERRVVLGGYDYLTRVLRSGAMQIPPYRGHELGNLDRLQNRVAVNGDEQALRELATITGLRFFLIDRRVAHDAQIATRLSSHIAFENGSALVVTIDPVAR